MMIETKFSIGDVVVPIGQTYETVGDPCPMCDGTGQMALVKGGFVGCNNRGCYRGLINRTQVHPWAVDKANISRVGKVTVETEDNYPGTTTRTKYMIHSTGVGSGRVWDEDCLYASQEEAQEECERRNGATVAA